MRQGFYEWMFPWPSYCRDVAWVILILWSAFAGITAIVYGLSFDIPVTREDNESNENYQLYESGCWNTSLQLRIENELSNEQFNRMENRQNKFNASGYGGSDTGSWLLSLFQSLMFSIFLWQPLMMMLWAILCVWMFTWHIPISYFKIPTLCRRCCCGPPPEDAPVAEPGSSLPRKSSRATPRAATGELGMLATSIRLSMFGDTDAAGEKLPDSKPQTLRRASTVKSLVVANPERPLDMISFLANDEWIIDDTVVTPKGPGALAEEDELTESLADSDGGSSVASPQTATGGRRGSDVPSCTQTIELQTIETQTM